MSAANYDEALKRLLVHEGGYTNHPNDPGGPTNFGITIADYRMYVKKDATAADVKNMDLADAKKIYRAKYWDALRCSELPSGVDYCVFDFGVNSGIARSARYLRAELGLKQEPATITDSVLSALAMRNPTDLVERLCDARLAFLKGLKTWPVFGKGWGRRVAEVRVAALNMALKSKPGNPPPPPDIPTPKPTQPASGGVFVWLLSLLSIFWKRQ